MVNTRSSSKLNNPNKRSQDQEIQPNVTKRSKGKDITKINEDKITMSKTNKNTRKRDGKGSDESQRKVEHKKIPQKRKLDKNKKQQNTDQPPVKKTKAAQYPKLDHTRNEPELLEGSPNKKTGEPTHHKSSALSKIDSGNENILQKTKAKAEQKLIQSKPVPSKKTGQLPRRKSLVISDEAPDLSESDTEIDETDHEVQRIFKIPDSPPGKTTRQSRRKSNALTSNDDKGNSSQKIVGNFDQDTTQSESGLEKKSPHCMSMVISKKEGGNDNTSDTTEDKLEPGVTQSEPASGKKARPLPSRRISFPISEKDGGIGNNSQTTEEKFEQGVTQSEPATGNKANRLLPRRMSFPISNKDGCIGNTRQEHKFEQGVTQSEFTPGNKAKPLPPRRMSFPISIKEDWIGSTSHTTDKKIEQGVTQSESEPINKARPPPARRMTFPISEKGGEIGKSSQTTEHKLELRVEQSESASGRKISEKEGGIGNTSQTTEEKYDQGVIESAPKSVSGNTSPSRMTFPVSEQDGDVGNRKKEKGKGKGKAKEILEQKSTQSEAGTHKQTGPLLSPIEIVENILYWAERKREERLKLAQANKNSCTCNEPPRRLGPAVFVPKKGLTKKEQEERNKKFRLYDLFCAARATEKEKEKIKALKEILQMPTDAKFKKVLLKRIKMPKDNATPRPSTSKGD